MWVFVCTARFGLFCLAKNAETQLTHIHTYTPTVCFLFLGASNHARGSRTSNKVVRCTWVFVCTARFCPFYLAKNAKTEPTHIHTYTPTVCFLFLGALNHAWGSPNLVFYGVLGAWGPEHLVFYRAQIAFSATPPASKYTPGFSSSSLRAKTA